VTRADSENHSVMGAPGVGGVHHVVLNVSDLERSVEFYAGALGMHATLRMEIAGEPFERLLRLPAGTTGRVAYVQGPERVGQIELIEWSLPESISLPDGPAHPRSHPAAFAAPGHRMVSFSVSEPLARWQSRLQARGGRCWGEPVELVLPNYGPIDALIVEDPDGHLVELVRLPCDEEIREFRRTAPRAGVQ
jgi:lactoylglutathione lyase